VAAILVVEDDAHQRLLLTEELAEDGHSVHTARNADDALAAVSAAMPDLVIVDIAMPGIDGLELLSRLLAVNNRLPVIIHTAYSAYKDNFMSWAADAYVVKRADLTELRDAVRCVLAKCNCPLAPAAVAGTA